MADEEQALAYAHADFDVAHTAIMRVCFEQHTQIPPTTIADLGCGAGDIAIRLARHYPFQTIHAYDGAEAMLVQARQAIDRAGMTERIQFQRAVFPEVGELGRRHAQAYGFIVSNSLLHHLHDPNVLWDVVSRLAQPRGHVFIADLMRPQDESQVQAYVDEYARGEPEVLRRDFYNSLCAAFTLDEVRAQLAQHGLPLELEPLDDIHLMVSGALT